MKTKVETWYTLEELERMFGEQNYNFMLIDCDTEVKSMSDLLSIPKKYQKDITAYFVEFIEGEIGLVFVSESNSPYGYSAIYRILPFYRVKVGKYFPSYWKRNSYTKKAIKQTQDFYGINEKDGE